MPFFMLILGKYVLSEEVGKKRLLACIVGFAGTVLVVQPSFTQVGWPALLPVFVAANLSVFMLITRTIAKRTDPISLQAVSGLMAIAVTIPLFWVGHTFDLTALQLKMPDTPQWFLLISIGVVGTAAHLLMTWALRFAPSATLAPMQYLEIPFATLIGLAIFGDLPNGLAALGIVITMAAGLFIVLQEGAIQRRLTALAPAQPAG